MTSCRDYRGYGDDTPDPQWPGGARVAVQFVLNVEEGSEFSIPDGDPYTETQLTESASGVPRGQRDLAAESVYEFGSRVGFWRIMRLFRERGLKLTAFACAMALERLPETAAALREGGHDLCCHGLRWEKHWELDEDEELSHIRQAVEMIARIYGERPSGWYCRYGPSANTRRLLVEEGGFDYDCDAYNDELPYWVEIGGRSHLVIPYTNDVNDTKFVHPGGFGTGADYFRYVKDTFDQLYEEGAERPKMMSVGLHSRIVGRPGRARALAEALDYIAGHDKVWICGRNDIARHWRAVHPAPVPGRARTRKTAE